MASSQNAPSQAKRFGSYLRKLRESRKLSLDTVEELAVGYSERVTKSHLSRIENGQAEPSFRRLFTLSQIYGVSASSLAERFEVELKREQIPALAVGKSEEEVLEQAASLCYAGRYQEALALYDHLLERDVLPDEADPDTARPVQLRLYRINCLVHMAHHVTAKEESEEILDIPDLSTEQRVLAMQFLTICCFRLEKYTIATLSLERAEQYAEQLDDPRRTRADLAVIRGNIQMALDNPAQAVPSYERAEEIYGELSMPFEQCKTRRNMASALLDAGEVRRARSLLHGVLRQAKDNGYDRHLAYALSDMAALSWKTADFDATEHYCIESNRIARPREYFSLVFRNSFYLWKISRMRSDEVSLKTNERTLRSYVSRVDETMPETREFATYLSGGAS